jgi:hypothetical protein
VDMGTRRYRRGSPLCTRWATNRATWSGTCEPPRAVVPLKARQPRAFASDYTGTPSASAWRQAGARAVQSHSTSTSLRNWA